MKYFQAILLVIVGALVFSPALHGGWLWDDARNLVANPLEGDPLRLWKIWFVPGSIDDYYPLLACFEWGEEMLWSKSTFGYHLTTLSLHLLNALLVWRLFSKFHLRFAWLGGLIFAIHPIMVESVAWMSEEKNTLSLLPLLLAMCFFLDYEKLSEIQSPRARIAYRWSVGLFLVALLAKVTVAPFPFVILLHAWWKRNRISWRNIKASAPFFGIALVVGLIALIVERHQVLTSDHLTFADLFHRLPLLGIGVFFYLSHYLWPFGLTPICAPWRLDSFWAEMPPNLMVLLLLFALWVERARWGRLPLFLLGIFLLFIAPGLIFIVIKYATMVWSLDHLAYISMLALIGATVVSLEKLDDLLHARHRLILHGALAFTIIASALESRGYAAVFVDRQTLWNYTLQHNPHAWQGRGHLDGS